MADWHRGVGATAEPEETDRRQQQQQQQQVHEELPFASRRSPVICRHGCVATSQPLASQIGIRILQDRPRANAADAAIAIAAVLAVTEPCSTGLGGDMFCLYYSGDDKRVKAINGSGRAPSSLSYELLRETYPPNGSGGKNGIDGDAYVMSPHAVTVPGAARGWEDLYHRYASKQYTFAELLEPAAQLAEEGFPVAPVTSYMWKSGMPQITKWINKEEDASIDLPLTIVDEDTGERRGPEPGELIVNKHLARVLRELGAKGATDGFYRGDTGRAIVDAVRKHGGVLSYDDLANHTTSEFPTPVSATYRDVRLWQVPPNGQGIAGLIALEGIQALEQEGILQPPLSKEDIGNDRYFHTLIEMMRLGFADARAYVADPAYMVDDATTRAGGGGGEDEGGSSSAPRSRTVEQVLDQQRIHDRAVVLFDTNRATIAGVPDASSCTVSFQVVDRAGNAVSFVNSNFMGFGTGIVPANCGFTLQNRGYGFTVDRGPNHPNAPGPSKRPCHTILPAILTYADDTNDLYATLSNMGGNMQPQGHLQLTIDMIAGQCDPQTAIDLPRFCIMDGTQNGTVFLEKGIDPSVLERLRNRGHDIVPNITGYGRAIFGRAQIIKRDRKTGVLWAGSDGRADGCAIGY